MGSVGLLSFIHIINKKNVVVSMSHVYKWMLLKLMSVFIRTISVPSSHTAFLPNQNYRYYKFETKCHNIQAKQSKKTAI